MLSFVTLALPLQMLLTGLLALVTFGQVAFSHAAPTPKRPATPNYVSIITRHHKRSIG